MPLDVGLLGRRKGKKAERVAFDCFKKLGMGVRKAYLMDYIGRTDLYVKDYSRRKVELGFPVGYRSRWFRLQVSVSPKSKSEQERCMRDRVIPVVAYEGIDPQVLLSDFLEGKEELEDFEEALRKRTGEDINEAW